MKCFVHSIQAGLVENPAKYTGVWVSSPSLQDVCMCDHANVTPVVGRVWSHPTLTGRLCVLRGEPNEGW